MWWHISESRLNNAGLEFHCCFFPKDVNFFPGHLQYSFNWTCTISRINLSVQLPDYDICPCFNLKSFLERVVIFFSLNFNLKIFWVCLFRLCYFSGGMNWPLEEFRFVDRRNIFLVLALYGTSVTWSQSGTDSNNWMRLRARRMAADPGEGYGPHYNVFSAKLANLSASDLCFF